MASHAAQPNRFILWTRRVLHLPGGATDEFSTDDHRSTVIDLTDPEIPPVARDAARWDLRVPPVVRDGDRPG